MPALLRNSTPADAEPDGFFDDAPEWMRVVTCALGAAFVSAAIIVSAVFAAWLASVASTVPAGQAVAAGVQGWLFAHGASPDLVNGRLGLIPWLATLLPLASLRWSAQRLLAERTARPVPRRADVWIRSDIAVLGAGFAGTYALVTFLAATLARLPGASVNPLTAAAAGFALATIGYGLACVDGFRGRLDRLCPRLLQAWRSRLPAWLRTAVRPAWRGTLALGALGCATVVGLLALNASRVASLYADLGPGWVGGFVLTLGQALYLPSAAAWAVAFAAGPGFGVGSGTAFTVRGSEGGALPLVPVLGALPDPGPMPPWVMFAFLVPVVVGAGVGWMAVRPLPRLTSWRRRAAAIGASCGLTGLLWTLIFVLCSGPLGYDRLGHVGVDALPAGAALTGDLLVGGLIALALSALRGRRIARVRPQR
ncbi:MAG: DUF6350 family protein [Micrococcales bacterium]|nr:DUF6350 family protein [Micrococcales bacterium]